MKKSMMVFTAIVLLVAGGAQAAFITAVSGADINTSFSSGVLTLSDTIELVVTKGTQVSYNNTTFSFSAELLADNSVGGQASGVFGNGAFTITASDSTVLLSGQVQQITLEGIGGGTLLGGAGVVSIDAGSLLADIAPGYTQGEVVAITFQISPGPIADFSGDYTGRTNLTIVPIPEPATMTLLGVGVAALMRRKRG
ncbi:MAG TPA: PEP-CTERM sorting domain-containing protein [Phycisphaerales bacterium]|nr:PEP-CTERM sorting domain-containing protein [Phycisphaerales bacterium]